MSDALTELGRSPVSESRTTSSPVPIPPLPVHTGPATCNTSVQTPTSIVSHNGVDSLVGHGTHASIGVGQYSAEFGQYGSGAGHSAEFRQPDALPSLALPPFMPSDIAEPRTHPDRYTDYVDRVEQQQDELRDARENLLGARVRLKVQRAQLQSTREKAAVQAGGVFNLIRTHLLKIGFDLPADIDTELAKADASRDALGIQELEYEEAEESYNSEEWKYTEKETQFIEDLPRSIPAPAAHSAPMYAADSFRHFSYDPQDVAYMVTESEGDSVPTILHPGLPTSDQIDKGGENPASAVNEPSEAVSTFADQATDQPQTPNVTETTPQASNVTLLTHPRLKWSETLQNIDEWLLKSLKSSSIETERLKKLLPPIGLSDEEWWDLIRQYWTSEDSDDVDFHTGDTTVSDENFSQAVSSNTMRRLFNISETSESESRVIPPMSVLAQERVLEAPDLAEFPRTIKRRDLVEKKIKHVSFSVRSSSTHSGTSTQQTNLTLTSSHQDCSSISTIDESLSSASSDDGKTVRHGKHAFKHDAEAINQAGTSTKERPSLGELIQPRPFLMAEHQSMSPDKFDYIQNLLIPGDHPPLEHDVPSPLPESELDYPGTSESMKQQTQLYTPGLTHAEPESLIPQDSYFPDIQIQTEVSVEPYIRVKSPHPWNLPLLRLTALPTPPRHSSPSIDHANNLKHIPFVTLPDAPFRLPGPLRDRAAPSPEHMKDDLT